MKKKIVVPVILLSMLFVGCGSVNDIQEPTNTRSVVGVTLTEKPIQNTVTATSIPAPVPTSFPSMSAETIDIKKKN